MRTKAFCQLKYLSLEFIEPNVAFLAMRVYLEKVLAHAKATCIKNLVSKYVKSKIAFNDVESIARSAINGMKANNNMSKTQKQIENTIMQAKLSDASKSLAEAKKSMNKSKVKLDVVVRRKTVVREMFNELVTCEAEFVWYNLKEKHKNKYKHKMKNVKHDKKPQIIDGIIVGDEALDQLDVGVVNWNEKAVITYDNIRLNQDEEELLRFPPEHQIYPKISAHQIAVELEKTKIKSVWETAKTETHNQEQLKLKEVAGVTLVNDDETPLSAHKVSNSSSSVKSSKSTLNFTETRATSWKNVKRVGIIENNDDIEESLPACRPQYMSLLA